MKSDKYLKECFKNNSENLLLPSDFALATFGERDEVKLDKFPVPQSIYDLGEETIQNYSKILDNSKVIFFKGLPGKYKKEGFSKGTETLLKAIEKSKADTYIIGEETLQAVKDFKIDTEKVKYMSKNSEVVIKYLLEEPLPALEVLKEKI